MLVLVLPIQVFAADADNESIFTFSDSDISVETVSGSGYKISGTDLTINASGTYTVTGSCSEGSITVKKGTTDVTLILEDLTLASSSTAPVSLNKTTQTNIIVKGNVTLTDNEDPANESSSDTEIADAFEGAVIKVKAGSTLDIGGDGKLTVDGSACKNGIKGASTAAISINDSVNLLVKANNNGIASDGSVVINGGTINITAVNDGLKSEPDEDDTESDGIITVNSGSLTINAQGDGIQASGNIYLNGGTVNITGDEDAVHSGESITVNAGTYTINSVNDGIQAEQNLTINSGTFNITTFGGYKMASSLGDNSAKGLKASTNSEDADTSTSTNTLTINGGSFTLNCADDAIHSDAYIAILGGNFNIQTGDDAVHADTTLNLGASGGYDSKIQMTVTTCYEGLEAGTVNIYSGYYDITSSDDGINAAGGSTSGTNNQQGNDRFNPGGRFPGAGGTPQPTNQSSSDYSINITGGHIRVNAAGDGIDSNGNLNITGGYIVVFGMQAGGDNEPFDYDGSFTLNNATVFAAGSRGMGVKIPNSTNQKYVYSTSSISSGKTVNIKNGSTTVFNIKAPKALNYVFYSSPSVTSSYKISSDNSSVISALLPGEQAASDSLYPDVKEGAWYYTPVMYVSELGYFSGYSNGYFGPADILQRQDFVVALARIAGADLSSYSNTEVKFTDVKSGAYYSAAVAWALDNGIVSGYQNGKFGVGDSLTREQLCTILCNYLNYKSVDTSLSNEIDTILSGYKDASNISNFALSSVAYCVENGIVMGTDSVTLSPVKGASRAEIATILMRMSQAGLLG